VLVLPRMDGVCFEAFLAAFRRAVPTGRIGLVLDGAGSHGSGDVRWPAGVEPVALPAYRSGNRASRPAAPPY
jgi:hypothetical protein